MAQYRIMALPPSYKKGGGRKKKEIAQPGQWAGANPQIVQPGEEDFDLPASSAAPGAEFAIQQMSPEEQAAYLKKARYDEAMTSYKPLEAEYKGLTRPSAQLILGEDYDADPSKFTNAGYFPIKNESGNYELVANKDIANLIYQKGVNPDVLSKTFGLGSPEEIQKQFSPIYEHAASIHAKRNKEKIDGLVKSGMTKDQAIQSLVKQGEGNLEGLTNRYGTYTDAAFKKAQTDASKITTNGEQPSNFSKELYEGVQKSYNDAYKPQIKKAEENVAAWDPYAIPVSESTAVRNTMLYDLDSGEYKTKGTTAHEDNRNSIAKYENIIEESDKGQKEYVDAIKKLALDKNLTDDQKKSLLSNPQAVEQLVGDYNKWRTDNSNYTKGNTTDYTNLNLSYDQAVQDIENNKTLNVNNRFSGFQPSFDPYMRPARSKTDISFSETGEGTYHPATKAHAIDGGVDMLDEEWLMGVIGMTGLPKAYQAANVISKFAPIASVPALNIGNVLTAKGIYDAGTSYIPNAKKAYDDAQEEGWNTKNAFDLGYNTLKAGFSALPLSQALQEVNAIKKVKNTFSAGDAAVGLVNSPDDPLKNYKAIKALGAFAGLKKQKGGSIQMELSQDEINDYVKRGFIVEEVKVPAMQSGGTPSQLWYQYTGTPWSEAKAKGLTDGSMEKNLALAKRLQAGEFGEPKLSNEQYQDVKSGYDQMVGQMVGQGKTIDELVQQRVGTREGLKARFPELFKTESKQTTPATTTTPVTTQKSQAQKDAELKAAREWLTGKAKEIGSDIFDAIGDSYWGKLAKKAGSATIKYLEAEAAKNKVTKAKEAQKVKAVEKKVEKKVESTVKKVITPIPNTDIVDALNNAGIKYEPRKLPIVPEQRPKKTPTIMDILNQKSIFDYDPLENLKKYTKPVEEKKSVPMTTYDIKGIVDQIQKGQKMGPPPSLTRQQPQQPIANGMGSNFAQGQNIEQINARNKAMGITPQNLPEVKDKSIWDQAGEWGSELWNDTKETASQTWEGTKDLAEEYIADPLNETIFGTEDFPTSTEEFIETTPGRWLGKKVYDSGLLPKEKEDQLKRKLEKLGELTIKEEAVKIDPNKKIKKIVVKENAPVDEFTEEIGSSGDGQYLSYRNQWDNKKGFEYITTRDNYDRPDDESYDDVIGVGHYLLDAYIYGDKTYSHKNNQGFLRKAKENNDWIPAFKKTNSNKVSLIYKKPSELTDKDIVVAPLRQYKFSSINFNEPISSTSLGYNSNAGIKHLTTKEGDEFKVTFSNPDLYGRHSGASVVFIFKDKFNNTIVRDFAGSLNQIKAEGQSIIKDYELKDADLTIGYHDVASYGAKPKADSSGKLKGNTWKNWNNEPHTGGALIIPRRKNQISSNKRYGAQIKPPSPFK